MVSQQTENAYGNYVSMHEVWKMIENVAKIEDWHDVRNLLIPAHRYRESISLDWLLPVLGYELLAGNPDDVKYAMAAMACSQLAIIIADDILDEEPGSLYTQIGTGRATNVSMALQATSHILLDQCHVKDQGLVSAHRVLSLMVLETAKGQELDSKNLFTEEDYWRIVKAKSSPYYGFGLELGARLACADEKTAANFYAIGATLGEIIQILDDLEDAFQIPANPDWIQGRNNLAILYALSTEHPDKTTIAELRLDIGSSSNLQHLQQILIDSGAVSYCIFQIYQRLDHITALLDSNSLKGNSALKPLFESLLKPIDRFRVSITPDNQTNISSLTL